MTVDLKGKKAVRLLHELYPPSRSDDGPKAKVSLTCRLFRSFVHDVVSAGKIRCVGVAGFAEDAEGLGEIAEECRFYRKRLELRCSRLPRRVRERAAVRWSTDAALSKRGVELAVEVLAASRETARSGLWRGRTHLTGGKKKIPLPLIDGADMLYMPLVDNVRLDQGEEQLSVLLVDEAQDSNAARREMCLRVVQQNIGCRVVAVGDAMQSIYAFCGADHGALALFEEGFTMRHFPLSTCYRCPLSHIELANGVIDKVNEEEQEAAANEKRAPAPELRRIRPQPRLPAGDIVHDADFTTQPQPGDASLAAMERLGDTRPRSGTIGILSRTNAPLLALRDCLAVRHVAVRFEGIQPLAAKLKRTLQKIGARTFSELKDFLWAEATASFRGDPFCDDGDGSDDDDDDDPDAEDEPKLSARFKANDMRACLSVVVERLEYESKGAPGTAPVDLADVERRIDRLFERDVNLPPDKQAEQVVLSSVHRAKGLEWDTVYLLQSGDLPLERVMEWGSAVDRRQERNVQYVAYTRAKRKLVFLRDLVKDGDEPWSDVIAGLFAAPPPEEPVPTASEQEPWEQHWRDHCRSASGSGEAPSPAPAASQTTDDPARALGLAVPPATRADLLRAYRRRVLVVHPDKQKQQLAATGKQLSPEDAKRLFVEATDAYHELKGAFDDDDGVCE